MKKLRKILPFILNRYVISILAFFIYVMFFDTHNLLLQRKLKQEEQLLTQKRDFYINEIKDDRQAKEDLMSNDENKEKYAREQYKMKRDNEDVFVVVPQKKDLE